MTIRDAMRSGRLPRVGMDFIIKICNSLSIPAKDLEFELTDEQLKRLQFNPDIHKKAVGNEVKEAHYELTEKYRKLIDKYQNLSYYMGKSGYLDDPKKEIDGIIKDLEKAELSYSDVIRGISIGGQNLGFDSRVLNPVDSVRMGISNKGIERTGNKLSSQYEKLEELRSKDFRSKFKMKKNEKRINKVCARISKLQAKQGKMQATQKKIVNKGSAKYSKKKMREMEKFYADYNRYRVYGDMKASLKQSREDYEHDINQTKAELAALEGKVGLVNGAKKVKTAAELAVMNANLKLFGIQEKAVERLRTKQGRCKLGEQYYRTIARSLAA